MSEDIWELMNQRKTIQAQLNLSKTRQKKAQAKAEYTAVD
jgi:hypothetical protein